MDFSNKKSKPRLQFIESLLYWEGKVHRKDLIEKLGVSAPQASLDLKEYRKLSPENITYDPGTRHYTPTKEFIPKFYEPNAYAYLGDLLQYGQNLIEGFNPGFGIAPCNTSVAVLRDSIKVDVIRYISLAIKNSKKIAIHYLGMADQVKVNTRWIAPQIIFFDGMRWQTRAFCYLRKDYRTFTLSRILEVDGIEASDNPLPADEKWQRRIDVILIPGTKRTLEQQKTISKIYEFDGNNQKVISVRTELLPYFLLANRLYPFTEDGNIVIKNLPEVEEIIKDKPIHLFL